MATSLICSWPFRQGWVSCEKKKLRGQDADARHGSNAFGCTEHQASPEFPRGLMPRFFMASPPKAEQATKSEKCHGTPCQAWARARWAAQKGATGVPLLGMIVVLLLLALPAQRAKAPTHAETARVQSTQASVSGEEPADHANPEGDRLPERRQLQRTASQGPTHQGRDRKRTTRTLGAHLPGG